MVVAVCWVRVRRVVVVMVMCNRGGSRCGSRVGWEAQHIKRSLYRFLLGWMMVMVMRVQVVMMVVSWVHCFAALAAMQRVRGGPAVKVESLLISRLSGVTFHTLRSARLPVLDGRILCMFALIVLSRRTEARWCRGAIHGLRCGRRRASHTTAQAREHAPKFHFDAGVVASRAYMSRLRALHGLWQWRVATSAIQFWADTQQWAVT